MANNNTSLAEKTQGHWAEIFNEFITNDHDRFHQALANTGNNVASPFNLNSNKKDFRLDLDFENKNGRGHDNTHGSMTGTKMISELTGDSIQQAAYKIHQFIDNQNTQTLEPTNDEQAEMLKNQLELESEQQQTKETKQQENKTPSTVKDKTVKKPIATDTDTSKTDNSSSVTVEQQSQPDTDKTSKQASLPLTMKGKEDLLPLTMTDKAFLFSTNLAITPQFMVNQLANKVSNKSVLNQALIKSVNKNNLKTLKTLLKNPSIDINTKDELGTTLLMSAIEKDNSKIINTLLAQEKLDINALDNNGNSALMNAIYKKSSATQLLIKQHANLNVVNAQGDSAISLAVDQNNTKAVKTLVQQGVKITNTDADKNPLILAATKSVEMLQLFNHQSLAEQDKNGNTSLNIAIKEQIGTKAIKNIAQIMNSHDINIKDHNGQTPLMSATRLFDKNAIQAIIKKSDVNLQDKNGDTALHHAVNNVDNKTIELLIKNKANVNLQDNNGNTALHHAVTQSNKTAAHLIKAGADINTQDFTGDSALTMAARDGNLRSVVSLMRAGAKVDLTNNDGLTASQVAKPLSISKGLLKLYEYRNNRDKQNTNTQTLKQKVKATALQKLQARRTKAKEQGLGR